MSSENTINYNKPLQSDLEMLSAIDNHEALPVPCYCSVAADLGYQRKNPKLVMPFYSGHRYTSKEIDTLLREKDILYSITEDLNYNTDLWRKAYDKQMIEHLRKNNYDTVIYPSPLCVIRASYNRTFPPLLCEDGKYCNAGDTASFSGETHYFADDFKLKDFNLPFIGTSTTPVFRCPAVPYPEKINAPVASPVTQPCLREMYTERKEQITIRKAPNKFLFNLKSHIIDIIVALLLIFTVITSCCRYGIIDSIGLQEKFASGAAQGGFSGLLYGIPNALMKAINAIVEFSHLEFLGLLGQVFGGIIFGFLAFMLVCGGIIIIGRKGGHHGRFAEWKKLKKIEDQDRAVYESIEQYNREIEEKQRNYMNSPAYCKDIEAYEKAMEQYRRKLDDNRRIIEEYEAEHIRKCAAVDEENRKIEAWYRGWYKACCNEGFSDGSIDFSKLERNKTYSKY